VLFRSIIAAFFLFTSPDGKNFVAELRSLSYLGVFIAGMLFPFGFTAPFSVGFFVTLNPQNIILNGFIGALGAAFSNLLIFSLVRFSFKEELLSFEKSMEKMKVVREIEEDFKKSFKGKIRHYLMYVFIGILIASPLSDEIADAILAGFTKIKPGILFILSFILHVIGIIILIWI
jgi:hypothetical protein